MKLVGISGKNREYLKDKIDELATKSKNSILETCIEE
jgi:hypothetical protein